MTDPLPRRTPATRAPGRARLPLHPDGSRSGACRRPTSISRPVFAGSATTPSARPARGHRDAARRAPAAARRADGRRQEPDLPAPGAAAAGHDARGLAADLADARPGGGPRGARRARHLPRLDPRGRRAPAPHGRDRPRPLRARLRRARAPRRGGLPGAAPRTRLLAPRRRRGPLHQRVGSRLPARVPARSASWWPSCPRRGSSPAPPPPRRWCGTRSSRASASTRPRRRSCAASRGRTSRSACARSRAPGSASAPSTACSAKRSARRPPPRGAAIVYAPTRRATEDEAERLARAGWQVAAYHAGLEGGLRDEVEPALRGRRPRRRRRDERLRHGDRPRRRARRRPPRARPTRSRPTTRRWDAPAATGRRAPACCSSRRGDHGRCAGAHRGRRDGDADPRSCATSGTSSSS